MCGIAGMINCGDQELLQTMTDSLAHRGPDDQGIKWFESHRAGLGHRRLAIIDLSALAHQPFPDGPGKLWITFNGEIYNFQDVRRELISRGYSFRSHSDTEVILYAYQEWGNRCLDKLNGMFAFAIWDESRRKLFIARDRLGVKPLYYHRRGNGFIFASEIKAILASRLVRPEIDSEALKLYLSLQYVPAPRTMFKGIYKLPPGHMLEFECDRMEIREYWHAPYETSLADRGEQEHAAEFRELFSDAVKIRMISDVPIGAFLSGGLDSSIVVSEMAKLSNQPVQTYSVGFAEGGKRYDELEYAQIVSDHCKSTQRSVTCNSREATERIPDLIYYLDEPVNENLIYPLNKVSRLAKKTASVVLTGEGADEFLLGYRYYSILQQYEPLFKRIPRAIKNAARAALGRADLPENVKLRILAALLCRTTAESAIQWSTFIGPSEMKTLVINQDKFTLDEYLLGGLPQGLEERLVPSYLDSQFRMVDYILMRTDKMSMETALECRSPFLDYRVVEYMTKLPLKYKNPGGISKFLLRSAFSDALPREILSRRKKPFAAPIHAWLYDLSRTYMPDSRLVRDSVISRTALERYTQFGRGNAAVHSSKLWLLVMLEIWYRTYIHQDAGGTERQSATGLIRADVS